jgi:hypothetical protein
MEMKKKIEKGGGVGDKRGDAVSCPQAPVIVVSYLHSYTIRQIQH